MIYFIEAVGLDRVKVGTSVDPEDRLSKLTCAMPCEVRLLKVIPGGWTEEHALHRRWNAHRVKGEWFVLSAIRAEIESMVDASAVVDGYRTCQRCGVVRQSKTGRYRGFFCRACGAKDQGERRRKLRVEVDEKRCVCVECGARVSKKTIENIGLKPTHDGAARCRPCAMKHAWSHPAYREKILEARAKQPRARKMCLSCGKPGVNKGSKYHASCWTYEQHKRRTYT